MVGGADVGVVADRLFELGLATIAGTLSISEL